MTAELHADRLRLWATIYEEDGVIVGQSVPGHLCAAADEIERLRSELLTLQNIRNQDLATFHAQRSEIERLRGWIDSLEQCRAQVALLTRNARVEPDPED